MSSEILFLSHRIPFPPDRGDKIRSHHILKRLARIAPVHVATFADDEGDMAEEVELATLARSYRLVRRSKPLLVAGLEALRSGRPVSQAAFADGTIAQYVAQVLAERPIGVIYMFSGQMGQYIPDEFRGRVVADFVDVDSAKFEAYAARSGRLMRWIEAREARLLRAEESRLARRADVSLLVSAEEAELFVSRLGSDVAANCDVRMLPNGIDAQFYDPSFVRSEPRVIAAGAPRLIFTGQMDYVPNVAAALRVADRILPLVRRSHSEASFHVVGRNPTPALQARHGRGGVHVWGRVDDIRPWLKAGDVVVVPLEIARGVQTKVLEAMAMAKPVVLTRAAATGIPAVEGFHFAIADSDAEIVAKIQALADNKAGAAAKSLAARRFVAQTMGWPNALRELPTIIGRQSGSARDAA
ncbi:MAG: TIGR03087 family PEP-CTERM/XrtA system glycosyltransferase [Novosphingobium sp.]|nr:TIGR03087 family PEP-CTERM/XrtA system glycosyltransferase [Novosphingobium sp.]